jgi:hypothetical protein
MPASIEVWRGVKDGEAIELRLAPQDADARDKLRRRMDGYTKVRDKLREIKRERVIGSAPGASHRAPAADPTAS